MLRSHFNAKQFAAIFICLILSACGAPAKKKSAVALVTPTPTVPVLIPTPSPLSCTATASAAVLTVFGDSAGNLLATLPSPPVQVTVASSRAGAPVTAQIVRIETSSSDFRVEPESNVVAGQIVMRPYKKGTHSATISVATPDNLTEVAKCSFQTELRVTSPPDLRVMIAANGAGPAITLSEGQGAIINWAAVNATTCVLSKDGVALPNQPTAGVYSGQFQVGPFANAGMIPLSSVYGIECQGPAGAGLVQRAAVGITVNPVPRAELDIVGAGAAKTIRQGESVDVAWTSEYATSGCLLSNGVTGQFVPPSGQLRMQNITANVQYAIYCRDNYRGLASDTVNVAALNPRVVITANGIAGNYTQGIRESFTIAWAAVDVTSCSLPFNDTRLAGAVVVSAMGFDRTTTYTVTCQSYFGSVTSSVTVAYLGDWYQTSKSDFGNQRDCTNFCGGFGKANVNSPDGSRCASGELIPPSALGKINFSKGCGSYSCSAAHGAPNGRSDGGPLNAFCWGSGQKTNKNNSDEVMGCFCR